MINLDKMLESAKGINVDTITIDFYGTHKFQSIFLWT